MAPHQVSDSQRISYDEEFLISRALMNNDLESFRLMMKTVNVDLNEPCTDGYYLMHRAATAGSKECIEYLINQGALVNVHGTDGLTPLDLAVIEGEFDCAAFLISNGANIKNIRYGSRDPGLIQSKPLASLMQSKHRT